MNNIFTICIDDLAALGKTLFANNLRNRYLADGHIRDVFVFRIDWTLAKRKPRLADLKILKK